MKFMFIKRESLSIPDGISQFLFSISDALLRLGHQVVCVTSFDDKLDTIPQRFQFENYPELEALDPLTGGGYNPRLAARLWRSRGRAVAAKHAPNLIVLNGALPVRFKWPSALLAHDLEKRNLYGNIGRILFKAFTYRLVDQLIVTCPELTEGVAQDCLCSPKRFSVIPTCIDTRGYLPRPLSERHPVILHCGLLHYKNPLMTIQAFTRMRSQHARLVLVGKVDPAVESEIGSLPVEIRQRIEMPGMVSAETLKNLLTTSRVMSVPSLYLVPVASPTALEAMASHTPCVLSSCISKIVANHGVNCYVEDSVQGMAARFDELMTHDHTWQTLSNGCARTKTRFDSITVAAQYIELAQHLGKR